MPICHEHKCTFFHIPKTAGISVCNALGIGEENIGHSRELVLTSDIVNYFTFTFVRNPWDRLVSAYCYLMQGGRNRFDVQDKLKYLGNCSFRECVLRLDDIREQQHFQYMSYWLPRHVDFVGKFERLQEDFNVVCDRIGLKHIELPHVNRGLHNDYKSYYDDETWEIVANKYAGDIQRFGYEDYYHF